MPVLAGIFILCQKSSAAAYKNQNYNSYIKKIKCNVKFKNKMSAGPDGIRILNF